MATPSINRHSPREMELPKFEEDDQKEPQSPSGSEGESSPLDQVKLFFLRRSPQEQLPRIQADLEQFFSDKETAPSDKAEAAKYLAVLCQKKGDFEKRQGQFEEAEKQYAEARKYFEEGWKVYKHNEKLILDYIEFLQKQEDLPGALKICSEALKENPQKRDLFRLRANLYASLGKWSETLKDSLAFLEFSDPREIYEEKPIFQIEMHTLAGDCCVQLKRYEEAREHFEKSYKLNYKDLGKRAQQTRKLLEIRLLEGVPKDRPEDFYEKKLEGALALSEKDPEGALRVLRDMLEPEELSSSLLCELLAVRAKIHVARGELVSAEIDLERLQWRVLPEVPESDRPARRMKLHSCWALVCLKRGEKEEARGHFEKAWEERQPSEAFVLAYLEFLKAEQSYEEAIKVCEESYGVLGEAESLLFQAEIYSMDRRWFSVKQICDRVLSKTSDDDLRLKAFDLAAKASKGIRPLPFEEIYYYLREAYCLDRTPHFFQRHAELLEAYGVLLEKGAAIPRKPPQKSDEEILEIAEALDPEETLEVLGKICFEGLTFSNLWKALLIRAEAYMKLGRLSSSRENIETAWRVVHPKGKFFSWLISSPFSLGETMVLCARARLCILEGKLGEALKHFERGWKNGKPCKEFVWQYLEALVQKGEYSKALEICHQSRYKPEINFGPFDYWNWRVVLHFEAKEWSQVIEAFKDFFPLAEEQGEDFQLAGLEKVCEAYLQTDQHGFARAKALQACKMETDPSRYLHWMEKIEEISKARILYEHVGELIQEAKKDEKLPLPQRIAYLKEIRSQYQEELSEWRKAKLSWALGRFLEEANRLDEALKEY